MRRGKGGCDAGSLQPLRDAGVLPEHRFRVGGPLRVQFGSQSRVLHGQNLGRQERRVCAAADLRTARFLPFL